MSTADLGVVDEACAALIDGGVSSIALAVARGSELVHEVACGMADAAAGIRASASTPYLLASVTKPITATAVCLLAQEGELDLDASVTDFLGALELPMGAGFPDVPTIRQVLHHTGGFGTYYDFTYEDRGIAAPSLEQVVARYAVRYFLPGERYEYSNLGYGILGRVVETVAGCDLSGFICDAVLGPQGIATGHVGPDYPARGAAKRYARNGSTYPIYDTSHPGASLGWMNAGDLAIFGLGHAGCPGVLSPASLENAHRQGTVGILKRPIGYAAGGGVRESQCGMILTHTGGMGGVSTLLTVVPRERLSVAVLVNQTARGDSVAGIRDRVLDVLVGDYTSASESSEAALPRAELGGPQGNWRGMIETYAGQVVLHVIVPPLGPPEAAICGGEFAAALESEIDADSVVATFPLQLPTEDALIASPKLRLALRRDADRLIGSAAAVKGDEDGGRLGNCLGHWCELSTLVP